MDGVHGASHDAMGSQGRIGGIKQPEGCVVKKHIVDSVRKLFNQYGLRVFLSARSWPLQA
jgi:hypothetical protein